MILTPTSGNIDNYIKLVEQLEYSFIINKRFHCENMERNSRDKELLYAKQEDEYMKLLSYISGIMCEYNLDKDITKLIKWCDYNKIEGI